jgi:phosphohistidine phosphatase
LIVFIMRHAQADVTFKGGDPPISKHGAEETERLIELANQSLDFGPNVIVSSPLLRARQTAELATKKLRTEAEAIIDERLYGNGEPGGVVKLLSRYKKEDRVLLISHIPLIFELVYHFIGGRPELELRNGSIAAVEFKGKAADGKGKLVWLIQPGV